MNQVLVLWDGNGVGVLPLHTPGLSQAPPTVVSTSLSNPQPRVHNPACAQVQLARDNFSMYDTDMDGMISMEDFALAMGKQDPIWQQPEKKPQLKEMYDAVDHDHDGVVRFEEFAMMRVRKKGVSIASPAKAAAAVAAAATNPVPLAAGDQAAEETDPDAAQAVYARLPFGASFKPAEITIDEETKEIRVGKFAGEFVAASSPGKKLRRQEMVIEAKVPGKKEGSPQKVLKVNLRAVDRASFDSMRDRLSRLNPSQADAEDWSAAEQEGTA